MRERLPALLAGLADARVVALASGDPLVAGIGGTLIAALGADQVRIHPAVSSVSLARARLGWAEETTSVLRLRGRDVDPIRRRLAPGARLLLLSRDADSPAEVAHLLNGSGFGGSVMTVFGDLGADAETRRDSIARDWSGRAPALNLVAVRLRGRPGSSGACRRLPRSRTAGRGVRSRRAADQARPPCLGAGPVDAASG